MSELGKVCEHGSFMYQCEICDLKRELEITRNERNQYFSDIGQWHKARDFWRTQCEALENVLKEAQEVPLWHAKDSSAERVFAVITRGLTSHRKAKEDMGL